MTVPPRSAFAIKATPFLGARLHPTPNHAIPLCPIPHHLPSTPPPRRRARPPHHQPPTACNPPTDESSSPATTHTPTTADPPPPPPSETPPLQRTFETFTWRGHKINYLDRGNTAGHPVIIIHGFGASINHWRNNIPALTATQSLRVFAVDLLGLGASDKPSPTHVTYSIELWAELVVDFIAWADVAKLPPRPADGGNAHSTKWSFVGNSIGSLVCLCAADALGKSRVRSICMMNCAGGMVSFRYSELNAFQASLFWLFNKILFNRFIGRLLFDKIRNPDTLSSVLSQVYVDQSRITSDLINIIATPATDPGACAVFLAILNGDAGPRPEPLLQQLEWCPMLVVWGECDPWTPLDSGVHPGSRFADYHSGLVLKRVANAGHCVHDECPDIVNEELVEFLLRPRRRDEDEEAVSQ